jgi:hypothetical protein
MDEIEDMGESKTLPLGNMFPQVDDIRQKDGIAHTQ